MWEWAYLNNPFGHPIVSLAFYDNKLIGHYAVIPLNLNNKSHHISGFLSMTTMVAAEARGLKLFTILATRVYNIIDNLGEASIVFGFPNGNSLPGFKKHLGWTILDDYKVVKVSKNQLTNVTDLLHNSFSETSYSLTLDSEEVKTWRTRKPSQEWELLSSVGLKPYNGCTDIMYLGSEDAIDLLNDNQNYSMILPINNEDSSFEVLFSYPFGYRTFNYFGEPIDIRVQMSMSDIF